MPKKGITFALAFDQSQFSRTVRKDGRVVEYTGLENRVLRGTGGSNPSPSASI